jgi:hypothetical protein
MPNVLVEGAVLKCSHGGTATLVSGDQRLKISNKSVITSGKETAASFASTCPYQTTSTPPVKSPCINAIAASAGISTLLKIDSVGVLLHTATGKATNPNDPTATWSVQDDGQTLLSVEN